MAKRVKKAKDTQFLYISARVRSMESKMLTSDKLERMIDARTDEDALKVLSECGYPEVQDVSGLEKALGARRAEVFAELASAKNGAGLVDVFRLKYDCHNMKTLLKAAQANVGADLLLSDCGTVDPQTLKNCLIHEEFDEVPGGMGKEFSEARDVLTSTGDPQLSDIVLDRACMERQRELARLSGSEFLRGYVRLMADCANLRSGVRAIRMGKGLDFLEKVLMEGGSVDVKSLSSTLLEGGSLAELFNGGPLEDAAKMADGLGKDSRFTAFERECENSLVRYLAAAKMIPFGEQPVVAFAGAIENEITAVRIIMAGRQSDMAPEAIRERLRETYV
ncbi:MAG: V-type ATPase subunit [Oscillospiraceae bacterium]|nr:V-type ATPase subunit [Oscillospiraceae bacterium]